MALNEHQQYLMYRFARLYAEEQGYAVKRVGQTFDIVLHGDTIKTCLNYDGAWQWVFEFLDQQI